MWLMQIMPPTWAMLTARHRRGGDPVDVRANILAGAAYLRAMWDRYGDVRLMLAAYNAGPGRADAYAAGRRGLPAETIAYVRQIAPELGVRSEEHTSELQSLMRISYAVFCLKKKKTKHTRQSTLKHQHETKEMKITHAKQTRRDDKTYYK